MSLISTNGASRKHGRVRPAERARTLIASAVELRVGVLNVTHEIDRHAVAVDGSLLFLAPADSPATVFRVAPRLPSQVVTVTAVDVANVPQPDRIRGTLRLTGPMRPADEPLAADALEHLAGPDPRDPVVAGPVLHLQPTRVTLSWHCESSGYAGFDTAVPLEEYIDALPDPLLDCEAQWLPHLHRDHAEVLRALAALTCRGLDESVHVRPLALDRHGLVLRLYAGRDHRDTRLAFSRPVSCGCEVRDAFNELLHRLSPGTRGLSC